jgi:hypothetical protein
LRFSDSSNTLSICAFLNIFQKSGFLRYPLNSEKFPSANNLFNLVPISSAASPAQTLALISNNFFNSGMNFGWNQLSINFAKISISSSASVASFFNAFNLLIVYSKGLLSANSSNFHNALSIPALKALLAGVSATSTASSTTS